jgi:Na+/H+ antiporter NhaD/arsenite permease-like protein
MILPFALWIVLIALAPHYFSRPWTSHYGKLALLFGATTIGYYVFDLHAVQPVFAAARDYFSFIVLIGSLYVVAGGIHISAEGESSPLRNVLFLAVGALVSNVLGTTGASMLLIRPWLRINQSRPAAHHVVFFIFIVANIGGGLTPVADPPLLIGYLKGVPFWWVMRHCWPAWLFAMGLLLGVFYIIDSRNYKPSGIHAVGRWHFEGLWNLAYLAVIVAAVFFSTPVFLREGVMLAAAAGSYLTTGRRIHAANQFHFGPMIEVGILFFGIFATMIPALDWLQTNARTILGPNPSPSLVYWSSGGLSSVLDSAPAYLAFASALAGVFGGMSALSQTAAAHIAALSIGTVFFGAVTYVGNGPNLMIKALAERQGNRVPSFPAYVFKWAVPILVPLLLIVWMIFVR